MVLHWHNSLPIMLSRLLCVHVAALDGGDLVSFSLALHQHIGACLALAELARRGLLTAAVNILSAHSPCALAPCRATSSGSTEPGCSAVSQGPAL